MLLNMDIVKLKKNLKTNYSGAKNAGKPLLIEGDMEWLEMSMSPSDMDFINSKNTSARDIATAFRVPPILLTIGGDATFTNMQEARLSLYEETIFKEEVFHSISPFNGNYIA